MAKTLDVVKWMERMAGDDPRIKRWMEEEEIGIEVAHLIYDARTEAGLTQKQLAELVGTKQPVIARLEDSDYHGHSLTMLHRIAKALDRTVVIRLVPRKKRKKGAARGTSKRAGGRQNGRARRSRPA